MISSKLPSPGQESEVMSWKVTASAPAGHTVQGGILLASVCYKDLMLQRLRFIPLILFTYISLAPGIVGV